MFNIITDFRDFIVHVLLFIICTPVVPMSSSQDWEALSYMLYTHLVGTDTKFYLVTFFNGDMSLSNTYLITIVFNSII